MKNIYNILLIFLLIQCGEKQNSNEKNASIIQPEFVSELKEQTQNIEQEENLKKYNPLISNFPNLDPSHISRRLEEQKEFEEISNLNIPFDSLSEKGKEMMSNELYYMAGPFNTAEIGCSWYCGAPTPKISATSILDSNKLTNYEPNNLHDFDLQTAWVENKKGYGIGEIISLEFDMDTGLKITEIIIFNGYSKNLKSWNDNSRVKAFKLKINNEIIGRLNLVDTYEEQIFKIGTHSPNSNNKLKIDLEILEVFKGEKYEDVAISEINFDGIGDH